MKIYGFDDSFVCTSYGNIEVDGVHVKGSKGFMRDPRLANPTEEMVQAEIRLALAPQLVLPNRPGEKYCSECAEWHPLNKFHKNGSRSDGYCYNCAECERERKRRGYKASLDRPVREYRRAA